MVRAGADVKDAAPIHPGTNNGKPFLTSGGHAKVRAMRLLAVLAACLII